MVLNVKSRLIINWKVISFQLYIVHLWLTLMRVIYEMKILKYIALTIGFILWGGFLIISIYTNSLFKW
jgi:hypothetical protein